MKAAVAALVIGAGTALGGAGAEAKELFLYNWTNYTSPEVLKKFEAETGIKVTLDQYESNEALLAKLQAGGASYDVIVPSDYMVKIMIDQKLLQKVEPNTFPNYKNLDEKFKTLYFDEGRHYTVPYMWGTTGLVYDTARSPKLEDSWKEFFEPRPELAGKVSALNDQVELIYAAQNYLGIKRCTEDPKEMKRVQDLLLAQKPKLAFYKSDGTIDSAVAKEAVMYHQWNGAAHRTKEQVGTYAYMYPKEGVNFWADNLAIPVGAKNVEEAKAFLNFMMDPKNIAMTSNFTGYMNASTASAEFLDESLKKDPAVFTPADLQSRLQMTPACNEKAKALMDKVWTNLKK
jgi:spermidine/putrescine transport system substrate-binding protein